MQREEVDRVAVVGAGLMGHGIALQFALGGREVWLNDLTEDALSRAMDSVRTSMDTLQAVGLVHGDAAARALDRIHTEVSLGKAVSGAGLVIEAVFEDLDLKRSVFKQLGAISAGASILASNTSSFMASQLAPETEHPEKVVVANWWNPPYLLPLVEVVPGPETASETVDTLCAILSSVGKSPVVLRKESLGFIGNRMQFALLREAVSIVEQGIASAEDVDTRGQDELREAPLRRWAAGGVRHRRLGHDYRHSRPAIPGDRAFPRHAGYPQGDGRPGRLRPKVG